MYYAMWTARCNVDSWLLCGWLAAMWMAGYYVDGWLQYMFKELAAVWRRAGTACLGHRHQFTAAEECLEGTSEFIVQQHILSGLKNTYM